jgi:hypothetical protein
MEDIRKDGKMKMKCLLNPFFFIFIFIFLLNPFIIYLYLIWDLVPAMGFSYLLPDIRIYLNLLKPVESDFGYETKTQTFFINSRVTYHLVW